MDRSQSRAISIVFSVVNDAEGKGIDRLGRLSQELPRVPEIPNKAESGDMPMMIIHLPSFYFI
jgi:hypothetical protein